MPTMVTDMMGFPRIKTHKADLLCLHGLQDSQACSDCIQWFKENTTIESESEGDYLRANPGETALGKELREFWMSLAEEEVERLIPKAVEYGAADLAVMGKAMQALVPNREKLSVNALEQLGLEMAIAFYALGKVARLFGSYERGKEASEDTWHDLGVYCRMAQKVRRDGRWV